MNRRLSLALERYPLEKAFVISRGSRSEAVVVVATVAEGDRLGRGECVPYARYGETPESVLAQIEALRPAVEAGAGREALTDLLAPGAARNAVDCALFDLEAKTSGFRAWTLAGVDRMSSVTTAFTLSVDSPEAMARQADRESHRPLLKIKLDGRDDRLKLEAVRSAAPDCELIADANEACRPDQLDDLFRACAGEGVALLEQPLPAGADEALERIERRVPVCADESAHDRRGLSALRRRYDLVNVKLDKTGGLTEALSMVEEAQSLGFGIMVGCMVATSLAMAPALVLAQRARFVDLDGPLLLAQDREPGLFYEGSIIRPPSAELWG